MSTSCKEQKAQINCGVGGTMQRNAAVLTVVCIMMCLTFNYTFPLHRKTSREPDRNQDLYYANASISPTDNHEFNIPTHRDTIADRSKKMASNFENALRRIKDSTQDLGRNIYDHMSSGFRPQKNILNEEDLRHYEQMVIMKKYPYLDLKELDTKYSPSKNTRQSLKFEQSANIEIDPGIWEPLEEGPNVEITNRGLTGFAIPPELSRHVSMLETKTKLNYLNPNDKPDDVSKISKKSSKKEILGSLKDDIKEYVEKKSNKLE
ncbi:uncharacterized protein LOC126370408 [Pectinophora gossypiella]|uniref:uncharacterized protein LOC126370408 n=1 Tax=Pectinophora gossypiella TaxID=13191 RepID=UPI00214ED0B2|nr:uncharacterized protein LOC126370408 [Pectinophora gossypiella]